MQASASHHDAIGRSERSVDTLDLRQARLMQLTLDRPADLEKGDPLDLQVRRPLLTGEDGSGHRQCTDRVAD